MLIFKDINGFLFFVIENFNWRFLKEAENKIIILTETTQLTDCQLYQFTCVNISLTGAKLGLTT